MRLWKLSIKAKKRSGQWGMSNLFTETSKKTPFCFYEKWQTNVWRQIQQQAAGMNGILSVNAETSAFCSEKTQKKHPLLFTKSED